MNCICTCIYLCAVACERDGTKDKERNMNETQRFAPAEMKTEKTMCFDNLRLNDVVSLFLRLN